MNFRSYRKRMGWTLDDAAPLLGLKNGSTVAKHELGTVMPSPETVDRYEKLTNGEVTASDFLDSHRRYRADPEKARAKIGARKYDRPKQGAPA